MLRWDRRCCIWRLATPLRKGVMLVGRKLIRFLMCFIIVLALMIYMAPKAC